MRDLEHHQFDPYTATPLSDTELAAHIQGGDNDAFAELWQRHDTAVAQATRRTGVPVDDVEDIVQETALKLWLDLRETGRAFTHAKGAGAYASRIAMRKAIDYHRYWSRRPVDFVGEYEVSAASPDPSPETHVVSEVTSAEIVSALFGHTHAERAAALQAIHIDGYSATEYAERTGLPAGTVRSRIHRGVADMRSALTVPPIEDVA